MYCYVRGSQLLELQNYKQELWLDLFLRLKGMNSGVWLGFTDIQKKGNWVALSNRKKITYTNWRKGEPNNANGKQHCVVYATDIPGWVDHVCKVKLQFVCKY